MNTVLGRIRDEKEAVRMEEIELSQGYKFNQFQTLRRIELYYNSKFESGEFDHEGFKKYFYNIVRVPCQNATKEIDLDTKDIILRSEEGNFLVAEIMSAEFKQWMKDNNFAKKLNEYADIVPKYGSVVVKKVKDELFTVDLKNLIVAYEPLWAIGKTADSAVSSHQMHEMYIFIKKILAELYGKNIAFNIPIIYGGSAEPSNVEELITQGEVDGFLVGHASLKASQFNEILKITNSL